MSYPWRGEEIERFRKLWADGKSIQECAHELGRTYASVEKARARFNFKKRQGDNWIRPHNHISLRYRDNGRETDAQARKWCELLARAR